MRETLKSVEGWKPAPIFREAKIAYTDANPLDYAEDDLFGYMRAPGGNKEAKVAKPPKGATPAEPVSDLEAGPSGKDLEKLWAEKGLIGQEKKEKKFVTLTRASPFKVSTLVSIAPLREMAFDFGTMSRLEDKPVPHAHEFYRTTLLGLFSIDLRMVGRFYHVDRTGFQHLDEIRKKMAVDRGLTPYDNGRALELDLNTRKTRLKQLLEGLSRISGGAKQALHYTDVAPKLLFLAVSKGGNHMFGTALGAKSDGTPKIQYPALTEVASVFKDDLLSGFYAGLCQGYLDDQRDGLKAVTDAVDGSFLGHPVEAIRQVVKDLEERGAEWMA